MPPTFNDNHTLNVVVETPKFSPFKYNYDRTLKAFKIKKSLPQGMHFPFNFGFIPGTLGEDGDPLDIIILSESPLAMGCVAMMKLIGVLEAEQIEKDDPATERNDRLIGCLVNEEDDAEAAFSHVSELPRVLKEHIEAFFIQYDQLAGKEFKPLGWYGPNHAKSLLESGIENGKKDDK